MSEDTHHLCCHNLYRHYGDTHVLTDFTLCVERGEFVALLGPSGCGKTTLLRLIAGFDRPDAGQIMMAGRELFGNGIFVPPESRRVGMVFQDYALFPHLNVARNVAYGLKRTADRENRVREILEIVGMHGLEDRLPHELSGGQQQRVALARALAPHPDVILLDEPFSNLDASLRVRLRAEVRDILKAEGVTTIFVTHDQEEALSLADKVAVMGVGAIAQVAPPEVLYRFPATREIAEFVGEANVLAGEAQGDTVICGLGKLPMPLCKPARGPVHVMLRPEWVEATRARTGEATVVKRMYFGHDQLVLVETDQGDQVQVRLGPFQSLDPGDRVDLRVTCPVVAYKLA
jgi:iron(III) transport system ATP-binding protein